MTPTPETLTRHGFGDGDMDPDPDGWWCRYEQADRLLTAERARADTLEQSLKSCVSRDACSYTLYREALARAERAEQQNNQDARQNAILRAMEVQDRAKLHETYRAELDTLRADRDREATARQEAERVSESRRDQLLKCSDERRAEWIRAENAEAALAARRP